MRTSVFAKPISGIDEDGRVVVFVNNDFAHVPVRSVIDTTIIVDELDAVTANTTTSILAGWAIDNIFVVNTTANAVTGGIRIGTTAGGTDVLGATAVGGNAVLDVNSTLLKRLFSTGSETTLYVEAVTAWNSASLNIRIKRTKVY